MVWRHRVLCPSRLLVVPSETANTAIRGFSIAVALVLSASGLRQRMVADYHRSLETKNVRRRIDAFFISCNGCCCVLKTLLDQHSDKWTSNQTPSVLSTMERNTDVTLFVGEAIFYFSVLIIYQVFDLSCKALVDLLRTVAIFRCVLARTRPYTSAKYWNLGFAISEEGVRHGERSACMGTIRLLDK